MISFVQHMSVDHSTTGASHLTLLVPNHTTSHPGSGGTDVAFDNLYPAIIQCFAIIFAGYLAGRTNMINASQARGIGTFVSKFCLPSLLLKSMCELKFDQVNWKFLASILIAKTVIFCVVVFFTILVKRPVNLGNAGLFAIFSTQSNDFAFGYPIVQALYEESHPDYLKYIYLVAPISLVFLNPIGFLMLELHKSQQKKNHTGACRVVLHVVRGVVTNPIVFMTALGIVANFIFKQTTPYIIADILKVLGDAYSASALFYLGLSLVGKVHGQVGFGLIVPVLLIMAKTILLPLITWEVVSALHSGGGRNETISLSMYGFLYGTFPTAPSVFLYASQYSIATEIIASGMVVCTFVAAPLMFISAKMMTLVVSSETDYKSLLLETSLDVSIVGMICCVWVAGVFVLSRKWRRIPHQFTLCLIFSQFLACLGMVLYRTLDADDTWQHYAQFVILLVGVLSSRCWTAMIALALCLERVKSLCYVLRMRVWFAFFGFGIPLMSTGILLIAANDHTKNEIDPSFHYGVDQTILSVVILFLCLVVSVVALVFHTRAERELARQHLFSDSSSSSSDEEDFKINANSNVNSADTELQPSDVNETDDAPSGIVPLNSEALASSRVKKAAAKGRRASQLSNAPNCHNCENSEIIRRCSAANVRSIEDIIPFPNSLDSMGSSTTASEGNDSMTSLLHDVIDDHTCVTACNDTQRRECRGLLRHYTTTTVDKEDDPEFLSSEAEKESQGDMQIARHLILIMLLCLSMFIGLFLCVWRLFNQETSGIYVEIEFIDGVFNYGQGFIVFALFGLDSQLIVVPFVKRWRRMMYGVEVVTLPKASELDEETKHTCEQFLRYHMDNCSKDIVKDLRYRLRVYKSVFTGTQLCEWLMEAGLVQNRGEALTYGRRLLMGGVLRHVKSEHHFHDMPYFYVFTEKDETHA